MRAILLAVLLVGARASAQLGTLYYQRPAPARRVVGRGARTIVEQRGRLFAIRPDGGRLELEHELPEHDPMQTSATVSPFQGRRDLLDVAVQTMWSNGQGGYDQEVHYIVRIGAHGDSLACRFKGEDGGGMGSVNHRTTVTLDKVSDEPLAFDVAQHTDSARAHLGGEPDTTTRYTIVPSGMCRAQRIR